MSKTVAATPEVGEAQTEQKPKRKTMTNWKVFTDAGFIPARVKCEGYKSSHPSDLTCHTAFPPTAENVVRHADPGHGGGWFRIKFRVSDVKRSPLWEGLEEAGLELKDFYCPHCRESVPVSPRRILYHLNNHPGANRVNLDPQVLCMWLGPDSMLDVDENDGLYDAEV